MLWTITVVLMTNPSRGSAFYFRRRDGEHYDRWSGASKFVKFDQGMIVESFRRLRPVEGGAHS